MSQSRESPCIYIYIEREREIIWYFVFLGRVTNPSAKPPFLEDQFVSLSLAAKRDMTRLEAAEMRFLRSVTGYTRLDKIRSEDIRQELEISGIQDVRLKYKQNWINHLERKTTPDCRNTPSPTNPGEEGIADAPGNDGNASMPEQVKRPNPWRKMVMKMIIWKNTVQPFRPEMAI